MTFEPRQYPAIVRDLLTTLTGGTVRESVVVPATDEPVVLDKLADRPIRRVSHLQGVIEIGEDDEAREIPYRFTAADFELIATDGGPEPDALRFRENGRRPAPGSRLTVNYYPVQTNPVPITDLNVGSVARTLMEAVAAELALEELQLEHVYESAFLETAEGAALDKVVALVGARRLPAGIPVVKVRFSRASGSAGRITIPSGTVVTDGEANRYATLTDLVLEPGEPSREVQAGGVSRTTQPVEAGAIDRFEMLIAGVSSVTNPSPSRAAAAPETDEALRRRARGALHAETRGTVGALRFGVQSIPGVKDVSVVEFPNGVPGEVRLDVAYEREGDPDLQREVQRRIDELRPAGTRVLLGEAAHSEVNVGVELTLAGTGVPSAELEALKESAEARLADHLSALPPGGVARPAQLVTKLLADERIVDAAVTLSADGGPAADRLELPPGTVIDVMRPFSFAPVQTEEEPGAAPRTTADVDLLLPIHLLEGVTAGEAEEALRLAIASHLAAFATPSGAVSLDVDGLTAAARDDSRYVIVRDGVLITVESAGRFVQLTEEAGSYSPEAGEELKLRGLEIDVREGGV